MNLRGGLTSDQKHPSRELAPSPLSAPHPLFPKLHPGSGSHYLENVFLGHLYEEVDNILTLLAQVILEKGSQVEQKS